MSQTTEFDTERINDLKRRLDDPRIAAAVADLLDHADLLAVLVSGASELLSRSDAISKNLSSGLASIRELSQEQFQQNLEDIDFAGVTKSLIALSRTFAEATPAIQRLVESDTISPAAIDMIAMTARALVAGHHSAEEKDATGGGMFAMLRVLKDPDVQRSLGFLIEVARELGKALDRERRGIPDPRPTAPGLPPSPEPTMTDPAPADAAPTAEPGPADPITMPPAPVHPPQPAPARAASAPGHSAGNPLDSNSTGTPATPPSVGTPSAAGTPPTVPPGTTSRPGSHSASASTPPSAPSAQSTPTTPPAPSTPASASTPPSTPDAASESTLDPDLDPTDTIPRTTDDPPPNPTPRPPDWPAAGPESPLDRTTPRDSPDFPRRHNHGKDS